MDLNWTRGVNLYGLVGTGAGFAAHELTISDLVVTNAHWDGQGLFRQFWYNVPGQDTWSMFPYYVGPGARFPYGFNVPPPSR